MPKPRPGPSITLTGLTDAPVRTAFTWRVELEHGGASGCGKAARILTKSVSVNSLAFPALR
jgi:hypothetical protein